ncbi:Major facilitator superfamily MFS_1 [Beijerinckiaceae bacterium RH AL1]|nr:MFS transporter [Beijerinckiaceae bacterium]VVB48495.1 Major facilitator superfamily MFS_1 [Beijerinckiaceae bacterium RH CH11]VVB48576.1 Major facilitator superfamily MFS_1 [Beijerinckiaceae bacterium RH AL8]VVC56423.1 Major facilitator superfamily MFS_1 [Beijerinckiaceae bacterium RH AL1]
MSVAALSQPLAKPQPRALLAACTAHVFHDGCLDLIYVLLPLWQAEFGLGYAALGLVRAIFTATLAGAQIPVDHATARFGARASLAVGTAVVACGFALLGLSRSLPLLCVALAIAGLGSSTQHPRASAIVTDAYGGASRGPLGIYNFAGDLGKAALPALTSLLLLAMAWRSAAFVLAALGAVVAAALVALVPAASTTRAATTAPRSTADEGRGFAILFVIGALDTATRMGFLLFLPFTLIDRHASQAVVGLGLMLVFAGGACGKFVCGWIGDRAGLVATVIVTEAATAAMIALVPMLPLGPLLALLPPLGVALNGTSSVLYGTVPDVAKGDVGRAFAIFYTGVMGASAVAPAVFGVLADHAGRPATIVATTACALATIPLVVWLGRLRRASLS